MTRLYKGSDTLVKGFIDMEHGIGPLDGNKDFIVRFQLPTFSTNGQVSENKFNIIS